MPLATSSEVRFITFAAMACLAVAVLWVPWCRAGLVGSASTFLGYGLLWSPAYRSMAGVGIDWSRVGAVFATTAMVWAILQMILQTPSAETIPKN